MRQLFMQRLITSCVLGLRCRTFQTRRNLYNFFTKIVLHLFIFVQVRETKINSIPRSSFSESRFSKQTKPFKRYADMQETSLEHDMRKDKLLK